MGVDFCCKSPSPNPFHQGRGTEELEMHELTIATNIKKVVEESLKDKTAKVCKIKLQIGKLTAVVPDSLRFCFQFVSEGTSAEGADLEIEEIPVRGKCQKCGSDFVIDEPVFICPLCGSNQIELLSGRELMVESREIEEE